MGNLLKAPAQTRPPPAPANDTPANKYDVENPEKLKLKIEQKLKPCCACPETRKARDDCIIQRGEEKCRAQIEAHKACMKKMGFDG